MCVAERSTNAADAVRVIRATLASVSVCTHEWDYVYSWIKKTSQFLFGDNQSIIYSFVNFKFCGEKKSSRAI